MAAIGYIPPSWAGNAQYLSPNIVGYTAAQAAGWKASDFLQMITTGTITLPNPNGAIAAIVGPTSPNISLTTTSATFTNAGVTVAGHSTSGAPAATYYIFLTYTGAASIESLPGAEFIVNCSAGVTPSITVAASGRPASTTGTSEYVGVYPGGEAQQNSATAFGSAMTIANPLTNNIGINQSVTNPSSNIVGFAINGSVDQYFSGTGGAATVNDASLFGATNSLAPLQPTESLLGYVIACTPGTRFEISLKQAFYQSLVGTTAGLAYDTAGTFFIADTGGGNKILNIVGLATSITVATPGIPVTGQPGDTGARVLVTFNGGTF